MPHTLFRTHRQAAGLTQTQAADLLGVSRSAIARWEAGKHRIPKTAESAMATAAKQGRRLSAAKHN